MKTTRNRCVRLLPLIAVIFASIATHAQEDQDKELYSLFEQSMNASYAEDFDNALRLAHEIRQRYPDEPAGTFALLQTYQTIQCNYRVRLFENETDSLMDLSIELAEEALKRDRKDGKCYFYLGTAYGFRCMYNAHQGKWMEAFRDGSQIQKNFNRAVKYSPEFYDTYYGIGLYTYWLGAKGPMRYLPFSHKKREEGIAKINIAAERGRFLQTNAKYGLLAVYFNEERYDEALELSNHLYQRYPKNPTLNYRRGHIFLAQEKWKDALAAFHDLYTIIQAAPYKSTSYQIECLYQMAYCNYEMDNFLESQRLCRDAIELERTLDFSMETDGPLTKFSDIRDSLHDLYDDLQAIAVTEATSSQ